MAVSVDVVHRGDIPLVLFVSVAARLAVRRPACRRAVVIRFQHFAVTRTAGLSTIRMLAFTTGPAARRLQAQKIRRKFGADFKEARCGTA
jgi:hypothetical protein